MGKKMHKIESKEGFKGDLSGYNGLNKFKKIF